MILLDSGSFLFNKKEVDPASESHRKTARTIAEIYRRMDYQAVNIGPFDLSLGLSFLLELNELPWISANFFTVPGNNPLFDTHLIEEVNGITFAFIGVSPAPALLEAEFSYKPWQQTLPGLVADLKTQVDCIFLLSSLSEAENKEIAHTFPSLRLLLTALPHKGNIVPYSINKTMATQVADRGKYLGRLTISHPEYDNWIKRSATPEKRLENHIKAMQDRMIRYDYLIDKHHDDSAKIHKLQENKRLNQNRLEELQKQLEKMKEEKVNSAGYQITHIPISTDIREDSEIRAIIDSMEER